MFFLSPTFSLQAHLRKHFSLIHLLLYSFRIVNCAEKLHINICAIYSYIIQCVWVLCITYLHSYRSSGSNYNILVLSHSFINYYCCYVLIAFLAYICIFQNQTYFFLFICLQFVCNDKICGRLGKGRLWPSCYPALLPSM